MHRDVSDIVSQAESDLSLLGKNDGILKAAHYLAELAKGHLDRPDFARGVQDVAYNVEIGTENDHWYNNQEVGEPTGLSFDPGLLIAALNDAREQLHILGHTAAVELARGTYDQSEEVNVEEPDRDNFWEKGDDGVDYIDEETFNLEVETYNEAREYLAGVAFAASSLVTHFNVDPDPSWEPS